MALSYMPECGYRYSLSAHRIPLCRFHQAYTGFVPLLCYFARSKKKMDHFSRHGASRFCPLGKMIHIIVQMFSEFGCHVFRLNNRVMLSRLKLRCAAALLPWKNSLHGWQYARNAAPRALGSCGLGGSHTSCLTQMSFCSCPRLADGPHCKIVVGVDIAQ